MIGRTRLDRLRGVNLRRNELHHEYPDVRAPLLYEGARVLAADLPGFFRDYAAWLRRLGFGEGAEG